MFVFFKKLTQKNAQSTYNRAKKFFKNNPKRRVCRTDLFNIRRGHVKDDILKHAENEVEITG